MRKVVLYVAAMFFVSIACKQESPADSPLDIEKTSEVVESLVLEAAFDTMPIESEGELLSLNYLEQARENLPEGKPLYSLCFISSLDGADKHWCEMTWQKTKGKDHFYAKEVNLLGTNGQPLRLNPKRNYKITGFLTYNRGNIDKVNRRVRFTPNKSNIKSVGAGRPALEMDIPLYFDWVPLTLSKKTSTEVLEAQAVSTEKSRRASDRIVIKPLGVLARIELYNDNDYDVRVSTLKLHSTVVSSSGVTFDLTQRSTPNISAPSLGATFVDVGGSQSYRLENPVTLSKKSGSTATKMPGSYLLWMMAKPIAANERKLTHITVDAKRVVNGVEQSRPSMRDLYVWGSVSAAPAERTRRRLEARIYRPKDVLEYFSDGYLQGNRSSFGTNSRSQFLFQDFKRLSVPGYRIINEEINKLWGGNRNGDVRFKDDGVVSTSTYTVNDLGVLSGSYTDTYKNTSSVVYALRFSDTNGRNYAAWRYFDNGRIESVYLGAGYKGNISDVANDAFWQAHSSDIVRRTYGSATSEAFDPNTNKTKNVGAGAGTLLTWYLASGGEPRFLRFINPLKLNNQTFPKGQHPAMVNAPMNDDKNPAVAERCRYAPVVLFQTNDNF